MFRNASQPSETVKGNKPRALIRRLFEEFRVIRRAVVHPRVPWHAKAVAGCAVLYIVSPIQVIPNFIPVIGQMDDVAVVFLTLRYLRRFVPASVLEECRRPAVVAAKSNDDIAGKNGCSTESTVIPSPPGLQ